MISSETSWRPPTQKPNSFPPPNVSSRGFATENLSLSETILFSHSLTLLCSASPIWCDPLIPVYPGPSQFYQEAQDRGVTIPPLEDLGIVHLSHSCIFSFREKKKGLTQSRSLATCMEWRKEGIHIFLLKISNKSFYPITRDSWVLSFLTYKAERIKSRSYQSQRVFWARRSFATRMTPSYSSHPPRWEIKDPERRGYCQGHQLIYSRNKISQGMIYLKVLQYMNHKEVFWCNIFTLFFSYVCDYFISARIQNTLGIYKELIIYLDLLCCFELKNYPHPSA